MLQRMQLHVEPLIHLTLTREEFRLIGLALSGKPLKGRDKYLALELNTSLQEARVSQIREEATVAARALENASASEAGGKEMLPDKEMLEE